MTKENAENGDREAEEQQEAERPSSTPSDVNIAMRCVLKNKVERFVKCFEDEEDPFFQRVQNMVNERDDDAKSPLDMASILGRFDMIKELISRGADITDKTSKGYSALHHAAAWGKFNCLKVLVENGANLQTRTTHGERPRETALRYNQTECVDYLDWAEAKQALQQSITRTQETIADTEKVRLLTRDDKTCCANACKEKQDWLSNTPDAVTQDFISQKRQLDEILAPIWLKLSDPIPEKSEKK